MIQLILSHQDIVLIMSLSYQPLQAVKVLDPRTMLKNSRQYAVLQSGKNVMYKAYTSNSISTSSIQFSCPPPSGNVIVDRKQYFTLPIRLTFTGDGANSIDLLQPKRDAPRAFPVSSSIDTLQCTINNTSVSINMADVIQPLLRFNTDRGLKDFDYSSTPSYPDQSQNYSDLYGTTRSPLSFYGDQSDESPEARAAFPFTIVSNTPTSAVVDMLCIEPLFLSPFFWGKGNSAGFYNVNTMDFNISFLNNLGARMWSHDNSLGTNIITNITVQFNGFTGPAFTYTPNVPQMLFTYISPQDTELISSFQQITYPYLDVTRFSTDIPAIAYSAAAVGAGSTNSTNNIQLSTIPRRMYLLARPNNATLYGPGGWNYTDTFYGISNVNIQFNNNLYLNSASQQQLYELAVRNGVNYSYNQWTAWPKYPAGSFTGAPSIGGVGSVVCLEFGTDIAIDSPYEAPGINGQYNLQVQANIYNADPSGDHDEVPLSILLIVVNEGSFTIPSLGRSITQLGVLSKADVLNAKQMAGISYRMVENLHGGDFLSGLKDFASDLWSGIKSAAPYVKSGLETALKFAPLVGLGDDQGQHDLADAVHELQQHEMKEMQGMGGRRRQGSGVVVGGRRMSRNELQRRMRY